MKQKKLLKLRVNNTNFFKHFVQMSIYMHMHSYTYLYIIHILKSEEIKFKKMF